MMSQITTIRATVHAAVFSLLIDRRAQAVAAVAMALIASAVLGSHDVSAGNALPGGPITGACHCH